MDADFKAFNFSAPGLVNVLHCPVKVSKADVTVTGTSTKSIEYTAIWDTGASASVITNKVAVALGLVPTSMTEVHTAGGKRNCNVYLVDIELPNGIRIVNVAVTEADMTTQDVLIGMDIITLGDLAITNYRGKTNLSFRIPPSSKIDFVDEFNRLQRIKSRITKNFSNLPKLKNLKKKRKQERQAKKKSRKK